MNERFVCVKVDREERPDVDQIYMTAVQMISGNGGWPMSVFLLPDARPFWGGTYFPARDGDRGNATGFLSVMNQIDEAWTTKREAVEQQADALTAAIKANQNPTLDPMNAANLASEHWSMRCRRVRCSSNTIRCTADSEPTEAAQVPRAVEPAFSCSIVPAGRSVDQAQRESAKQMLVKTLDGMISGAMYDHLGGGFHRYSVDRRWQIPHFEKMLYDNGQLASVYAAAYRGDATRRISLYRRGDLRLCDSRTCGHRAALSSVRWMRTAKAKRESSIVGPKGNCNRSQSTSEVCARRPRFIGFGQAQLRGRLLSSPTRAAH